MVTHDKPKMTVKMPQRVDCGESEYDNDVDDC